MLNIKHNLPKREPVEISITDLCNKYYELKSKEHLSNLSFKERIHQAHQLTNEFKDRDLYHYRMQVDKGQLLDDGNYTLRNIKQKQVVNLASNSYLDYSKHPAITHACNKSLMDQGVGSGSVPMFAGTYTVHRQLEERLASFTGYESAITFNDVWKSTLP